MSTRSTVVVVLSLTAALWPRLSPAQDAASSAVSPAAPPAPEDAALEQARSHFDQGLRLVRREHWDAALTEFEASTEAHPNWPAQYNAALCLRNLHEYRRALDAVELLLARHGSDIDERRRADAQALREEVRSLLTPLTITVNVDGATVLLDDETVGATPLGRALLVPSGAHRLEVRKDGYLTDTRRVIVVAGRDRAERVRLVRRPGLGAIRVLANVSSARVRIDGDEVGIVPYRSVLGVGPHLVEAQADGYRSASRHVRVEAGQAPLDVDLVLERRALIAPAWFWSSTALAAAASITTAVLAIWVSALDADYDPDAPDAVDHWQRGRDLMLGTDVALTIAGVSAASSLVLYFFTDWR